MYWHAHAEGVDQWRCYALLRVDEGVELCSSNNSHRTNYIRIYKQQISVDL